MDATAIQQQITALEGQLATLRQQLASSQPATPAPQSVGGIIATPGPTSPLNTTQTYAPTIPGQVTTPVQASMQQQNQQTLAAASMIAPMALFSDRRAKSKVQNVNHGDIAKFLNRGY